MRSPTNIPLVLHQPPQTLPVPRPFYPNKIISRLRTRTWYVIPTGPEYLYYQVAWNPAMRWHFRDVQADIKMTGAMAAVIMNDEIKGYCVVFCQTLIVPGTYRVKEIGAEYDPRKTY